MDQKKEVDIMPPQKTWFFTDSDGRIFPANEKEAFELLTNNSRWRRQDIKMLGCSDGLTYHKTIKEAGPRTTELQTQIAELKSTLNKYIAGHDKLMFEEFATEDDERVMRAKLLIKETEDKIGPLEVELKELRTNLIQRAFDAELEQARGHMEKPRDFSVIGKVGNNPQHQQFMENFKSNKRVI